MPVSSQCSRHMFHHISPAYCLTRSQPGVMSHTCLTLCPPVLCPCRSGAARVLITTDVWARGLDVQQVRALQASGCVAVLLTLAPYCHEVSALNSVCAAHQAVPARLQPASHLGLCCFHGKTPAPSKLNPSHIITHCSPCCLQVSLVINYDLPNNRENYIHRIGRSGADKHARSLSLSRLHLLCLRGLNLAARSRLTSKERVWWLRWVSVLDPQRQANTAMKRLESESQT